MKPIGHVACIAVLIIAVLATGPARAVVLIPYGKYKISVVPATPGVYANAFPGADLAAKMQAAVAALPNSRGTIKIAPGTYPISSQSIVIPSNVSVVCDPGSSTFIVGGTGSIGFPIIRIENATNFALRNCVVNGSRSAANTSTGLIVVSGSSYGTISGNVVRNSYRNGMYLPGGNTQITIDGNEFYDNGPPVAASGDAIALGLTPQPGNTFIHINNNKVHDNSQGIEIQPSQDPTSVTTNIEISGNQVYSNAGDGILVFSVGRGYGLMTNFTISNNTSYCNGWPPGGVGFSPNCVPGALQQGAARSGNGVGIEVNSPLQQSMVTGNVTHDNYYEGIDVDVMTTSSVNVSGPSVSWVSGDTFDTSWLPRQGLIIGGGVYKIASVSSPTQLTLLGTPLPPAGTQQLNGAVLGQNTISGNTAYNNGFGIGNSSGHGFAGIGISDIWSNNVAYSNQGAGFLDQISVNVSHSQDTARDNLGNSVLTAEFVCQGCLNAMYEKLTAYDSKQAYGLLLDSQTSYSHVGTITTLPNEVPLSDMGYQDVYSP